MSKASEKGLKKTQYMATIYDRHSHIERRVFEDEHCGWYVRINGYFVDIGFLIRVNRYTVDTWFDG